MISLINYQIIKIEKYWVYFVYHLNLERERERECVCVNIKEGGHAKIQKYFFAINVIFDICNSP